MKQKEIDFLKKLKEVLKHSKKFSMLLNERIKCLEKNEKKIKRANTSYT